MFQNVQRMALDNHIDKQRFSPVFLWRVLSYQEGPLGFFLRAFSFSNFILHVLPRLYTSYPSLNKKKKNVDKSYENFSFCYCTEINNIIIDLKKMYPKNTNMRSIRSSGVGNCLFLRALGWGTDHQERKKFQIRGVCPGGYGNRSNWTMHK